MRPVWLFFCIFVLAALPCRAQAPQKLTLQEAEQIALQNHPQIQAATQLASAATARVQEARSSYFPQVNGSVTGVEAENNSRIAAGFLNNPVIYDRLAEGFA